MTAAELASFRALLQAQAPVPPLADRGLFARMRARLTVIENDVPVAREAPTGVCRAPTLEVISATDPAQAPVDSRLADPPPAQPPAFGRRDGGAPQLPPPALEAIAPPKRPARTFEVDSTPDELDDLRAEAVSLRASHAEGSATGVIAGWSRARPISAQRRLLGRLEAVLLAEHEGLNARRAADSPVSAPSI